MKLEDDGEVETQKDEVTEDLQIAVEFGFERLEEQEVEEEQERRNYHTHYLDNRRKQHHSYNEDETMQQEERVEQTITQLLLAVHCLKENIEFFVALLLVEHCSRLHNDSQSKEG